MPTERKTRVLITGATGFLGGNILKAMRNNPGIECIAACRTPAKLPTSVNCEVRAGDLLDPGYRRDLVQGVDVICHAGTWASMWAHQELERERFFDPTTDLIEQAIHGGVKRFLMASTVAIGESTRDRKPHLDFSPKRRTGFWPHLDYLIELDDYMREHSGGGTQMVTLRLGHFAGAGNRLGTLPALVPRLKTWLVPWLGGGKSRFPLVADSDLGRAFELAALAGNFDDYESFNICGPDFPTLRELVSYIAEQASVPKPIYSVPYAAGYVFGWLMETLNPVLPGSSPFLTRSIVHLCEDWYCPNDYARKKLGYVPAKPWRQAVDEHLEDLRLHGFPWPRLSQV